MMKKLFLTTLLIMVSSTAMSAEVVVGQKDKQFTKKEVTIKKGDSIKFTNEDPFFHNVFSLDEKNTFDLGSYPKGESKSVKFDKPGKYDVECAIHPNMKMTVKVE